MENILVCVGVYKSTIILKTYISIYNNNNNLIITIDSDQGTEFQFNEGKPTLTCLINGNTKDYQKNFPDEAFTFV
jgi:DNA polymerase III sliding clamp (beta) subunit (PCNA family)